jgi:hypothetical protein
MNESPAQAFAFCLCGEVFTAPWSGLLVAGPRGDMHIACLHNNAALKGEKSPLHER